MVKVQMMALLSNLLKLGTLETKLHALQAWLALVQALKALEPAEAQHQLTLIVNQVNSTLRLICMFSLVRVGLYRCCRSFNVSLIFGGRLLWFCWSHFKKGERLLPVQWRWWRNWW